jgi:hypothetical protein
MNAITYSKKLVTHAIQSIHIATLIIENQWFIVNYTSFLVSPNDFT